VTATERIRLQRQDGIATILIDRAEKRNAFDHAMWQALRDLLEKVAGAEDVQVVVLRAVGSDFSAGGDITEMKELLGSTDVAIDRLSSAMEVSQHLEALPMPTVAAMRGAARGGGLELALACDLRLADHTTTFALPPARMGLVYGLSATHRLVTTVGLPVARRLLLLSEVLDAEAALEVGLIDRVCSPETFEDELARLVDMLCRRSPTALRGNKEMLRRASVGQARDDEVSREIRHASYIGPDLREAVTAFVEGRPPNFRAASVPGSTE
jgi:enoyl-CoA hydratase